MLDALTQRLTSVVKTLRGHARLTEENVQEMLREVRLALLVAGGLAFLPWAAVWGLIVP